MSLALLSSDALILEPGRPNVFGLRIAQDPELACDVAGWFWQKHGLNALADADDVRAVTRRINGGENGLTDRIDYLTRAKFFLRV